MRSRYLPYATRPGRLLGQLLSDILVVVWTFAWVLVGMAVHTAVSTIATVGRDVHNGAHGIATNLESAGRSAEHLPLVGGAVSKPLTAASEAALDIAGAGHNLDTTATWLAVLLALAVAGPPILAVMMPWLFLRLRFFRRKWTVTALAATPAGEQLLALRALANRPLRKLTAVNADPVAAWRREDPVTIHGLAALELRSAGVRVR
ncbi:hypothetical protein [Mycobacterium noviomagense]|uniref:Transmembrane protein n=1 Tax=Mycobacterium noviomagense TaxID=459858 RepID=A0A7I7PB83_9MYCO|nr:hypothetical protein [Mycobacterium noviomagense]ORB17693.1 hypothetical protein BST37_02855 [Mycobacterium noviomagense]BBY05789.1 hypothetical protein MNVI_11070 [Mycobacterium noviomagense]